MKRLQTMQKVLNIAIRLLKEEDHKYGPLIVNHPIMTKVVKLGLYSALSAAISKSLGISFKVWKLAKI